MRTRWLSVLALGLLAQLATVGCAAPDAASDAVTADTFAELGGLTNYLEFPDSQQKLERCFRDKDQACLKLFAGARRAAAALFDGGAETALTRTLDGVATHCRGPRADWQAKGWFGGWQSCAGAAAALYFFSTDAEDQRIVQAFGALDEQRFFNMLVESRGYAEAWVGNRPDRARWVALIQSRTILDRAPVRREGYQNLFQTATPREARIAMVDPRRALTPAQLQELERALR